MGSTERPRRHDRVWLDPASWRTAWRGAPLDEARLAHIDAWLAAGRACVARRRDDGAAADDVAVAIALPLAAGRARIGWTVARGAVVRVAPPLALAAVVDHAPPDRRAALRDLAERALRERVALRVYGSYAWQAIAGADCVTAASDLDVLWDVDDAARVPRALALFAAWEAAHGLCLDGELRFPDGAAVAWRELASAGARVLVKRDDGVALEPTPLAARCDRAPTRPRATGPPRA